MPKSDLRSDYSVADRLGSLARPLLCLKFGPQLPFGFKPVPNIVTMVAASSDVDLKDAVGNLDVGVGSRLVKVTFAITPLLRAISYKAQLSIVPMSRGVFAWASSLAYLRPSSTRR